MMTAVSGSKAPRTAVMVLPMRLTLYTKLTLVMNVQMIAREARLLHCRSVVIGGEVALAKGFSSKDKCADEHDVENEF